MHINYDKCFADSMFLNIFPIFSVSITNAFLDSTFSSFGLHSLSSGVVATFLSDSTL